MFIRYFVEAPLALICFESYFAGSTHLVFGQISPAPSLKDPLELGQIGFGLSVNCELRVSPHIFPFQFPSFGWATEGLSETCPEATCFGVALCAAAVLKR